jgi:hypothetical protein
VLLPRGLHDAVAPIVGIEQDHHLDARRRLAHPHEWRRQLRGVAKGTRQAPSGIFFDVQLDTPGDHVITADQDRPYILMPPDVSLRCWVLHLGDRVNALPPLGLLGIIEDEIDRLLALRMQDPEKLLGLLPEDRFGVPACNQEEIVEARPVMRSLQMPIQARYMPTFPPDSHHQQAKIRPMTPVKTGLQGSEELVERGRHA